MDVEIRSYREEDKEACRELWKELTLWHREIYDDSSIGGNEPGLYFDEHLAKAGPDHLFVAVCGGAVVGLTGYIMMGSEAEVEPLVVSTEFRGRGIGTLLLEEVARRLKGTGIRYLNVRPVTRNIKALEFFRSHGFDKLGRIELFIDYTGQEWKKDLKLFDMEFEY